MYALETLLPLLLAASTATALPQPPQPQKRAPFKPEDRCKEFRPSGDELMLISYVGHNIEFDPVEGLGSGGSDPLAFILDSSCKRVIIWDEYEAQGGGKGFTATMGMSYDGVGPESGWQVTIEAHVGAMGPALGIDDATVKINDKEKPIKCSGQKGRPEGLDVDMYKFCNFKPGDVWPEAWWP